jgi:hypothetical protein
MKVSLEELTKALQRLESERMQGKPKYSIPNQFPASIFRVSPEVNDFLERRREYFELTEEVSVGIY